MGKSVHGAKKLIGRRVRLIRDITTVGSSHYPAGSLGEVVGTWRGRFTIRFDVGRSTVPKDGPGGTGLREVSQLPRSAFEEVQEE